MLKAAFLLSKEELKLGAKKLIVALLIAVILFSVVLCMLNIAFDLTDHLARKFDEENANGYSIFVKKPDFSYQNSKAYLTLDLSVHTYRCRMSAAGGTLYIAERGGASYQLEQAKNAKVVSGKEYRGDGEAREIWLSEQTAEAMGADCGDSVYLFIWGVNERFEVAGILTDYNYDFFMAPSLAKAVYEKILPLPVFAVFKSVRDYQSVFVSLKAMEPLKDESIMRWSRNIALVGVLLGAVAFLLFVTAMGVVYSTIHMLLEERTRFNGILRFLGASVSEIAAMYFGIFFVMITLAVGIGIGVSAGFTMYLSSLAMELFEIELTSSVSAGAVGITYCAALFAAAIGTLVMTRKLKKQSVGRLLWRRE